MEEHKICSRCVMDITDPMIRFDEKGVCNYCKLHDRLEQQYPLNELGKKKLNDIIRDIKLKGKSRRYDCIIGVSGGTDSTFQLYLARKYNLRPLVVHLDNFWDSDIAKENMKNALDKLGYDSETHIVDWNEFKDIQIAFLKASTPDSEIPTDAAIKAILYKVAAKHKIKYVIIGHSFRTEGKVPVMWSYGDPRYIKAVQKLFGEIKIRNFPYLSFGKRLYYRFINRIRQFRILYYIPYDKKKVRVLLKKEFNWQDYGGHHYESIYTRFIQGYVLPNKFNIDKRKREFSALIRSSQMSRDEALQKLKNETPLSAEQVDKDKNLVLKKFGLTNEDFEKIMNEKPKTFLNYPNNFKVICRFPWLFKLFFKLTTGHIPPLLYLLANKNEKCENSKRI